MSANDEPRFLARGAGYTAFPGAAIDRLEAITEEEQARQSTLARRRAQLRQREEWRQSKGRILAELERLRAVFGVLVADDLRVIRRQVDRLDGRVGR